MRYRCIWQCVLWNGVECRNVRVCIPWNGHF